MPVPVVHEEAVVRGRRGLHRGRLRLDDVLGHDLPESIGRTALVRHRRSVSSFHRFICRSASSSQSPSPTPTTGRIDDESPEFPDTLSAKVQ